ncbi:MAG: M23 family metallopeptidase [Silvanigrellaceae bacterium]
MKYRSKQLMLSCCMTALVVACGKQKSDSSAHFSESFDVSLVALRQTYLKSSTKQFSSLRPDELCKIEAGERIAILGSPILVSTAEGTHYKVTLSHEFLPKNACRLGGGVFFAEHFRQEVIQRGLQVKNPAKTVALDDSSQSTPSSRQSSRIDFKWPATSGKLTSTFGPRFNSFHEGIDLSVPTGTSVMASAAGQISFSGWSSIGYGHMVQVTHEYGFETRYGHSSDLLGFAVGKVVLQGDEIAKSGTSGNSTGPHIHFEIRQSGNPVDPLLHLPERSREP